MSCGRVALVPPKCPRFGVRVVFDKPFALEGLLRVANVVFPLLPEVDPADGAVFGIVTEVRKHLPYPLVDHRSGLWSFCKRQLDGFPEYGVGAPAPDLHRSECGFRLPHDFVETALRFKGRAARNLGFRLAQGRLVRGAGLRWRRRSRCCPSARSSACLSAPFAPAFAH